MNEYIFIGKIVNTHGIKGELRILSDFDKKELIFKKDFNIYIGPSHIKEVISTYRVHKSFDMISLNGYQNINEVLKYKGQNVYIKRRDLNLKPGEYLLDDLINLKIMYNKKEVGKVSNIIKNSLNILLEIEGNKKFYIPYNKEFIKKVDLINREVAVENIEGLML